MSFDLVAYFRSKPRKLPASLSGDGWIVNVEAALPIELDDVSLGLRTLIGRPRWQVEVHREGDDCAAANHSLDAISSELISSGGAIFDPQNDQIQIGNTVSPVPRLDTLDDRSNGFTLHCFFERADQIDRDQIGRLLDHLELRLPDALPHRYGTYEPPPYRWDDGGRQAFLERWVSTDPPFWIGKTPAAHVFESFDYKLGRPLRLFRAGHISFEFRAKLIDEPAKLLAVIELGEWLAINFGAFYTALVAGNETHGPFWKGMIPDNHLIVILGQPLLACWPEFDSISVPLAESHRQVGSSKTGLANIRPPEEVCYVTSGSETPPASPSLRSGSEYAPNFPFDPAIDPYQPE